MKKYMLILPIALCLVFVMSCTEKENDGSDKTGQIDDPAVAKSALIESNNAFALELFGRIAKNEASGENIFISPLSVYYALAMAYNGSEGDTKEAFKETLAWNNISDTVILESLRQLQEQLVETPSEVTLEIANSMWLRKNFPIKQPFIDVNMDYLDAGVQSLDFSDPTSVDIINNWIEDNTNDMIRDMLSEIPNEAVLYMINAIYFNGLWKYEFADTSNYEDDFTLADGTTRQVTYMKQREDFAYTHNDLFRAVQLPYNDTNYYMLVMLPHQQATIGNVVDDMNMESWQAWQEEMIRAEVTLSFPKFSFDYGVAELKPVLEEMGLGLAFDYILAEFTRISDEQVYINSVKHKARVEVNEQGTEAAAATIVEAVVDEAGPVIVDFKPNRPFLFAICEKQTNAILFMGKVEEPLVE